MTDAQKNMMMEGILDEILKPVHEDYLRSLESQGEGSGKEIMMRDLAGKLVGSSLWGLSHVKGMGLKHIAYPSLVKNHFLLSNLAKGMEKVIWDPITGAQHLFSIDYIEENELVSRLAGEIFDNPITDVDIIEVVRGGPRDSSDIKVYPCTGEQFIKIMP